MIYYCPTCKEAIPAALVEDTDDLDFPRHCVEGDMGPYGYKPRYHDVARREVCPKCQGDGLARTKTEEPCVVDEPCGYCGGDGYVERRGA